MARLRAVGPRCRRWQQCGTIWGVRTVMCEMSPSCVGGRSPVPSKKALQFTSTLVQSHNKLWGCHFDVPASIAQKLVDGASRRVICSINGSDEYQCALLPHGNGSHVVTVNKKLCAALGVSFGATVRVSLRRDESKYGLPMPEELQELLRQDKEGSRLFHSLTAGRQRTLLYIINSAKNPDSRLTRAVAIVRHLKGNKGKINYRQLNQMLRKR
jgi:hypothetical protein